MYIYSEERKFYEKTDPEGMSKVLEYRFWNRVDKTGSCWNWIGKKNKAGYGVFSLSFIEKGKRILAHRQSWLLSGKEIPEQMYICHHCDNPSCVRPDHLFIGTLDDNNQDMKMKWRHTWGIRHPQARMDPERVREIRGLWDIGLLTQTQIGNIFGIGSRAVSKIVTGIRWRTVA